MGPGARHRAGVFLRSNCSLLLGLFSASPTGTGNQATRARLQARRRWTEGRAITVFEICLAALGRLAFFERFDVTEQLHARGCAARARHADREQRELSIAAADGCDGA